MDQPTNAMVITALVVFDDAPGFEAVTAFVRDRLLLEPRFRQRISGAHLPLAPPRWEIDPDFDVGTHVHRIALPGARGDDELDALIGDIASSPLPRDRPLWQLHYVEGYGNGAAIVARLHHAMGDGVALVRMLLGIAEGHAGSGPEVGVEVARARGVRETAEQLGAQATTLVRLLSLPADPATPLKGSLGRRKSLICSRSFALERLKSAARRHNATLNDLLLAAITGALRAHLLRHRATQEAPEIRAMVPVYVRPKREKSGLGNHFGLVFVALPLPIADRTERLREVTRRTRELKAAPDAVVALEVLAALGVGGGEVESLAIDIFTRKASVMVTNVVGPGDRIVLAGKPVSSMVFWAPVSGHLGLGLSAMTYAGELRLGIAADATGIAEPALLRDAFEAELDALISSAERDSLTPARRPASP